jgi:hypothetical protein
MSAKKVARKKVAKKKKARPAAKKRAKRVAKKAARRAPKRAARRAPERLPRKEDVRDYTPGLPDMAQWPEVAVVLKVRPFYTGPDSVPFNRLRARLVPDPTAGNRMKNDFYLDQG